MSQIIITNISGLTPNYEVYVCNVYGDDCVLLGLITTNVPPNVSFQLPLFYDTVPVVGLKIIQDDGCEEFHILNCGDFDPDKLFQDGVQFYFMTGDKYEFQWYL